MTPADFDKYVKLCLDHPGIRGRNTIVTLVAIGAAESGLNNMAIGENAKNGTPEDSDFYFSLGLGWLQHDSGWLERDRIVNGVSWSLEQIRADPNFSLDLLVKRPGFIKYQGLLNTYIEFSRWAVWPKKSDAFMHDAEQAYSRLAGV